MPFHHNDFCRICKSKELTMFFSLGKMPPSNSFIPIEKLSEEKFYPLEVYFCRNCKMVQLLDVVEKEEIFCNYTYFSSTSAPLVEHFKGYAKDVGKRFLKGGELVVEIGSNDGVLLQFFKENQKVVGVEPAANVAQVARERGINTINNFFDEGVAGEILKEYGKAKVMACNNAFAHIDDIDKIVRGIKMLLADDGVYVFEVQYLPDLINQKQFDMIYHEHLLYYTLKPAIELFKRFDMEVFDVEKVSTHGGSIRVFVCKRGAYKKSGNVDEMLEYEEKSGFYDVKTFEKFAKDINSLKKNAVEFIKNIRSDGKRIIGYGAPAKGNTLLGFFGFGPEDIEYITDNTPAKIGLLTPGTHIPVVSNDVLKTDTPDYALLLIWNYKEAVLKREDALRKKGMKFIVLLPAIEVL